RRRRGGGAELRPGQRPPESGRPPVLPADAYLPVVRSVRHARLPAGQVQAALPRAAAFRRGAHVGRQRSCPDGGPRDPRTDPGERSRHAEDPQVGLVRLMAQSTSKRVLVTGLSTYWGARLARELEQNPDVDAII